MLQFPPSWRFQAPKYPDERQNSVPAGAIDDFMRLVRIASAQGPAKPILEHFKRSFSTAIGSPYNSSSSEGWAESDLQTVMASAALNPPVFIEAFYSACESLRVQSPGLSLPDIGMINEILGRHTVAYRIRGNDLVATDAGNVPIPSLNVPPTIAEEARQQLLSSSRRADQLLAEGHGREAVQENLWLLETVATAFQDLETEAGTVAGKYFNQIVRDLQRMSQNTTFQRVLRWVVEMHGYLSSPSGGGVRHGLDLNSGIGISLNEAQLFCNMARSYVAFFLNEHERLHH